MDLEVKVGVEGREGETLFPSPEEIEAARTPEGGWTREQLAEWGVPWPPPPRWKQRLALASRAEKSSAARKKMIELRGAVEALKAGRKLSRLVKVLLDGEEAPDADA